MRPPPSPDVNNSRPRASVSSDGVVVVKDASGDTGVGSVKAPVTQSARGLY